MKLKPKKRTWSQKFLDLAGSAPDFPYPDEPPPAEPGPELEVASGSSASDPNDSKWKSTAERTSVKASS